MTIPAPPALVYYNELAVPAFDEVAGLFYQREYRLTRQYCRDQDIAALDERMLHNLDHLKFFTDAVRALSRECAEQESADEAFVSTCAAFADGDPAWIQEVFATYLADEPCFAAVIKALAWLPWKTTGDWLQRFFTSADMQHKQLAVAVCRAVGRYPKATIEGLLKREDCREDTELYAQLVKTVGQMKDASLLPYVVEACANDNEAVAANAHWARLLLGDLGGQAQASLLGAQSDEFCHLLGPVLVRVLPGNERRQYLSLLLKNADIAIDLKIAVVAFSGETQAVPWLVTHMENPELASWAGWAFSYMTGVSLEHHNLIRSDDEGEPQSQESQATQEPDDSEEQESEASEESGDDDAEAEEAHYFFDADDELPVPCIKKVKAYWRQCHQQYQQGQRYFYGHPIARNKATQTHLLSIIESSFVNLRYQAKTELALLDAAQPYPVAGLPQAQYKKRS